MWEVFKLLFTLVGALLIFMLGLLAWRQQLLDKRRFEVAEQVLVMYAKLAAQIAIIRQRNGYDGRSEWIANQMGSIRPDADDYRYRHFMVEREWQYRIPDEKLAAFNEVYKDFTATVELSRTYLSIDIGMALARVVVISDQIKEAARVLARISPDPSIDPENQSTEHGEYIVPGWPYNPDDEPSPDEEKHQEEEHFPLRFADPSGTDAISIDIFTTANKLRSACTPYMNQGPYQFLARFFATLIPPQLALWWKDRPKD